MFLTCAAWSHRELFRRKIIHKIRNIKKNLGMDQSRLASTKKNINKMGKIYKIINFVL